VSVPRFLNESANGRQVDFTPSQQHQIAHVLRLHTGDRVRVFNGTTPLDYLVELRSSTHGTVVGECPQAPEPHTSLIACPALLRRDKFEPVLQKLTELGVAAIVPVLTARGLLREPPDQARLARWQAILREATEQCGRGRVPALRPALPFEGAVRRATAESVALVAYEQERQGTLRAALEGSRGAVSIFVGPEGGYTSEEVEIARTHGARLVTLGPRVLRTETASPVLAALVLYERGDLSSWHTV
jgi:16S rRNA (uracil1498-N3)-methyltransferase